MRSCTLLPVIMLSEVVFSAEFSVMIPKAVSAVAGSCAEIRCTFDYPDYRRIGDMTWFKREHAPGIPGFTIIYNSKDPYRQHYNYRGRAEFKCNIEKNQCSLLLKDIRKSDEGTYELSFDFSSAWYINGRRNQRPHVFLSVLEKPEISGDAELIAGQTARLNCSITHNCPEGNLKLKWINYNVSCSPSMDTQVGAEIRNESSGSRTVSSVITLKPSSAHEGKILGCTILIDDITTPSAQNITLELKGKPTILTGPTCTNSENWTDCSCRIRANPPGNITWGLNGRILTGDRSDVEIISWAVNSHRMESSLRLTHPPGTGNLISCVVANEHGESVSIYDLHSKGIFSRTIVLIIRGGATGIFFLIAVVLLLKIKRKKSSETACVPKTTSGAMVHTGVLNGERDDYVSPAIDATSSE